MLGKVFNDVTDKDQASQALLTLTKDENSYVRQRAADVLGKVFSDVTDKDQASQALLTLTKDENSRVRQKAVDALGKVFSDVTDKDQASQALLTLTKDENSRVRQKAVDALGKAFGYLPDKIQAWQDVLMLIRVNDGTVRLKAAKVLGIVFREIPDKDLAWQALLELTQDENIDIRWEATEILGKALSYVPNRSRAWLDILGLTQDENSDVQLGAAGALGKAFSNVPDKAQAWQDVLMLTQDEYGLMRWRAIEVMGQTFGYVPDKAQAWQDILKLTYDKDSYVREKAVWALGKTFGYVPDKAQAWQDILKLTQDENSDVRWRAARALGDAFSYVPNKSQAWQDILSLTKDEDSVVRWRATRTLGKAFGHVPNKFQAWRDILCLTHDKDSVARLGVASALGEAFRQIPDNAQAFQALLRLTEDGNCDVRMHAYHSLGMTSVLKATEAQDRDTLLRELNTAIVYFEKSSQEGTSYNPAKFCLPFYRSYFVLTFQGAKEGEVQRYLAEAKEAVGSSESKAELIKSVKSLAKALYESQKLKSKSVEDMVNELNTYRWYCDRAAEHMSAAEKGAPGIVMLMRKCNPLLEERIQATIDEIQKKAWQICQIAHESDTRYEALGNEMHKAAKALSTGDIVSMQRCSSRIVSQLKKFCKMLQKDEMGSMYEVIDEIDHETEFTDKLHKIELALSYLGPLLRDKRSSLVDVVILSVLPVEYSGVCAQLSGLRQPPDIGPIPNLYAWQFGDIFCPKFDGSYTVAIGMMCRAGNNQSILATREAISLWKPHYLFFVGVAGGLPDTKKKYADLKKGDVVIADVIYGYEYGKIEKDFMPRGNWTYKTDQGLLTGASAYAIRPEWRDRIRTKPPAECVPAIISGEIASGEKVIDDPTNDFFSQVIKMWPKIKAVEMEGAGVGSAIEQAQNLRTPVGFMVIRGISDLPRPVGGDEVRGTEERDDWKPYASDTASAFTVEWIADGLPLKPSALNSAHIK